MKSRSFSSFRITRAEMKKATSQFFNKSLITILFLFFLWMNQLITFIFIIFKYVLLESTTFYFYFYYYFNYNLKILCSRANKRMRVFAPSESRPWTRWRVCHWDSRLSSRVVRDGLARLVCNLSSRCHRDVPVQVLAERARAQAAVCNQLV